jgi:pimeloyl-ACP methyl ester carboxylesterase
MDDLQFLSVDGRRIAYRYLPGASPMIVFLPGYRSDMSGIKASAFRRWAEEQGRACLLFDPSGCGKSDGEFADGTLSRWRDELLAVIDAVSDGGPVLPVGSSMGGWLMLLVADQLGARLHGLMGIAAAPDFSDWGRSDEHKAKLAAGEIVYDTGPYGSVPFFPGFWQDGQANRRLTGEIALTCPVRLVHGMRDNAVPWDISLQLANRLRSSDVHLTLVKDGDHNLSREADIDLLLRVLATI